MNRTQRFLGNSYLLRCDKFKNIYENLAKLSIYVADASYYELFNLTEVKDYLFLVVDSLGHFDKNSKSYVKNTVQAQNEYKYNLEELNKFPYFITSYQLSRQDKYKQVLVFEIYPNADNRNRVKLFLNGDYSKIWDKDEIIKMFPDIENPQTDYLKELKRKREETVGILTKKEEFKQMFCNLLKEKYGTSVNVRDISNDSELDLPAKLEIENEIIGDESWLYLVGEKTLKENPQTIMNEDLI